MTALKRSLVYLKRKHKRSILLFLLLFVISCSISVGLSVWNNIDDAIKEIEQRMGTSFVMKLPSYTQNPEAGFAVYNETNYDSMTGVAYEGPMLDDNVVKAVMAIEGISSYNADVSTNAYLEDCKLISGLTASSASHGVDPDPVMEAVTQMRIFVTEMHGNTSTALSQKFLTGAFSLSEGRHIMPNDVKKVLISEEFATLNDLELGDTITVSTRLGMWGNTIDALELLGDPISLEIVGIFHVNGYQPVGRWVSERDITYNWLMTDAETIKCFKSEADKAAFKNYIRGFCYYNITFFVDDPTQLESVVEKVRNLDTIEKDFYDISIDNSMYKSTVEPLKNIRNIVLALVAVIVAGCTVVLMIVFTMWVRSRRQEISIYLSLGLSKASIFGQFVLEAAIVAAVAGVLAFGACQEVPNMIGNYMLADAIEDAQPEITEPTREEIHQAAQAGTMSELFRYESGDYAGPEQIDFTFHISDFFVMLLLELLIIVAAILKGGWFIFSMQPRKIMTDLR